MLCLPSSLLRNYRWFHFTFVLSCSCRRWGSDFTAACVADTWCWSCAMRALIERSIARGVAHCHIPAIHHLAYLYGCRQGKSSDASSPLVATPLPSALWLWVVMCRGIHHHGIVTVYVFHIWAAAAVLERHVDVDVDDYRTAWSQQLKKWACYGIVCILLATTSNPYSTLLAS
jgi:hypothetical protein